MRGCSCSGDQPRIGRIRLPRITSSVFTLSVAAAPGLIPALRVVLKNLVRTVAIGFGNENASAVINKALEKKLGLKLEPVEGDGRGELNIRSDLHSIESDRALIKPSNLPNGDAQKGQKGPG
jgi:hypothetical protein